MWRVGLLTFAIAGMPLMVTGGETGMNPLARERGRTRPLIVVAHDAADPATAATQRSLEQPTNRAALTERQVVVFTVIEGVGKREEVLLAPAQTDALMAALDLRSDRAITVVLVGKDGSVKLRRGRLLISEIIDAIDAMPMRRKEMDSAPSTPAD